MTKNYIIPRLIHEKVPNSEHHAGSISLRVQGGSILKHSRCNLVLGNEVLGRRDGDEVTNEG